MTVQPEESLELFAQWLDTGRMELITFNGFLPGAQVSPGQKIMLPFNKITPEKFEDKRLDFLQETEEDFFSSYAVTGQKIYRVRPGDTLWSLCHNTFDIPLWLLERYNSTLNLASLQQNQELVIPIIEQL